VPDQRPGRGLQAHQGLHQEAAPDARVEHEASLSPYLAPLGGPYNAAAVRAMRETFGKEPGFTREGGSIGAVLTMRKLLRAPVVFLGLSLPEHGYHAINENFDWGQARRDGDVLPLFPRDRGAWNRSRRRGARGSGAAGTGKMNPAS
jgi:acetylornithine deacetylase/succinyl-diaminopimelate desuccinylase-like protein